MFSICGVQASDIKKSHSGNMGRFIACFSYYILQRRISWWKGALRINRLFHLIHSVIISGKLQEILESHKRHLVECLNDGFSFKQKSLFSPGKLDSFFGKTGRTFFSLTALLYY